MYYYLNANLSGYLPEMDPLEFETLEEMLEAVPFYVNSMISDYEAEEIVWLLEKEDLMQLFVEGHTIVDFAKIESSSIPLIIFAYRDWEAK